MIATTKNYGMKKPDENEFFDIEDMNGNMDVIDRELKRVETASAEIAEALEALISDEVLEAAEAAGIDLSGQTDA